jgi:hypothetical protein
MPLPSFVEAQRSGAPGALPEMVPPVRWRSREHTSCRLRPVRTRQNLTSNAADSVIPCRPNVCGIVAGSTERRSLGPLDQGPANACDQERCARHIEPVSDAALCSPRKRGRTAMGVGACRVDTGSAQHVANDQRDGGDGDQPHGNLSSNCRASIRKSWVLAPRSAKQANLSSAARSAYGRLPRATLTAAARFRATTASFGLCRAANFRGWDFALSLDHDHGTHPV